VIVYLSGTYKDLVEHRKAAYQQLRMMRHDVIGMEDYVASDQRPTDKCLADVAKSDVYLGIFAWRYGFVPSRGNPQKRSITELEYRRAKALDKPCLVFLSQDDAPWPITMMDSYTGESGAGTQIKQLRAELADQHVVSFFATPDQLASRTAAAIFGVSDGAAITRQHNLVPTASGRRASTGRAKPRPKYQRLWLPGSVLRVRFMDDNPPFERTLRRYLPLWSVYANIQFEFSQDKDAEVRVAFRVHDGNWAYIGTDCMKVPLDQPTMNFGFLDPPEVSVLHEFGHVLGLLHEHNHPKGIKWNKQSVYKSMNGPPNNWDKAMTDANMFTKWTASTFPVQKPFDPISVMAYPMPKDWTALDTDFGHKDSLSAVDKDFIGRLYPFE
jgi:hypothetical protein